jgi:outer membrane protein TolC
MIRYLGDLSVIFFGILVSHAAAIAEPLAVKDLAELFQEARQFDPTYRQAQGRVRIARESQTEAASALKPVVALSATRASVSQAESSRGIPVDQLDLMSVNQSIQVTQPIYRPALLAQIRQAGEVTDASYFQEQAAEFALAARLIRALIQVSTADAVVKLQSERQGLAKAEYLGAISKEAAGDVSSIDVRESEATLALVSAELWAAEGALRVAREQVYSIVGLEISVGGINDLLEPVLSQHAILKARSPGDWSWVEEVLPKTPEVQAAQAQVRAADQAVSVARAGYLPTVDLNLRRTYSKSESLQSSPNSAYLTTQIGISMNWSLYQGGGTDAATRRAIEIAENARLALAEVELRVSERLKSLRSDLDSAENAFGAYELQVRAGAERLTGLKRAQALGLASRLEVSQAELKLAEYWKTLIQARNQVAELRATLNIFSGQLPKFFISTS